LYSVINISGLGIGLATAILILLWVQDELSFDDFHENRDDIYRVVEYWNLPQGSDRPVAETPYPLGPAFVETYPEISRSVRLYIGNTQLIGYNDTAFYENGLCFADSVFFRFFSFPLKQGDPETVLRGLNSLVISESIAEKYFGDEDPLGKSLTLNNQDELTITGIMYDVPQNSHLQFNFVVNLDFPVRNGRLARWVDHMYYTYIQLSEGADPAGLGAKIENYLIDNNYGSTRINLYLQPLKNVYLRSIYPRDVGSFGMNKYIYVYIFSVVALIVLAIGCINFMNLATAQSANRAREIGVRKAAGAYRNHIIKQFMGESVLISFLALLFAMIAVYILLPEYNALTGKSFSIVHFTDGKLPAGLLIITLITGLLAGSYPSLYLSSFQPVNVFKSGYRSGTKSHVFRRMLVIIQFTLALVLLIGTFVINDQLSFMRNKNLGLNKENMIQLRVRGSLRQNYETFKNELLKNVNIKNVALSGGDLTRDMNSTSGVDWEGNNEQYSVSWSCNFVDYDFVKTLDLKIIAGRDFSREFASDDSAAYILNETGAAILGFDKPVGKRFSLWGIDGIIIGIVKDFHFKSLHSEISPLCMLIRPDWASRIFARINSENIPETIAYIEEAYKKFCPEYPFRFTFLDQNYGRLYESEERISNLFQYFSLLAIFVSCLGLFGLSSFIAGQRTKEIGIRKVFGASRAGLVLLLSKEFLKWVIAANIIAWPVAWFVMRYWLGNFAYRAEIGLSVFLISGILAIVIALLTVSIRTLKASGANPVDSLRYE